MQRVYSVCSPKPTNDQLALQETVFHNANGYLGVRGTRGRVPCLRDGRTGTNAAAAKILRLFR